MSERYSAWIRIGGRINASKTKSLLKTIREAGASLGWGEPVAVAKPDDFPLSRCCRLDPDFPAVTKADWYDPDLNPDIPCSRDNCRDNSCSRCRSNWVTFF